MGNGIRFPWTFVFLSTIAALLVLPMVTSCSSPSTEYDPQAANTLEALGFTEPLVVARFPGTTASWQQGCGENDWIALDMRGRDAAGRQRAFVVCCGSHVRGIHGAGCSVRPW